MKGPGVSLVTLLWCVGVNVVNSTANDSEIHLFNNFIRDLEVEDVELLGRKFTWFHANGITMSRINRVLISEE